METKEIQKFIDFIAQSGLDEVNIETTDLKIKVKRYGSAPVVSVASAQPAPAPVYTHLHLLLRHSASSFCTC